MTLEPHELQARDRVTDALVGLIAVVALYAMTFFFLSPLVATGFMIVWAGWVAVGFTLRTRRPDLVRRLVVYEVATWIMLVLVLTFTG